MQAMPALLHTPHTLLALQKILKFCTNTIAWTVLVLAVLLWVQWPLREWVQAYSRQANDFAQIFFALLAAASIAAASAADVHLSAYTGNPTNPNPNSPQAAWRRWALAACVLPWALFMLWASAPQAWLALASFEKFGETLNPGFFIIKCAGVLMVVLILLQSLLQLLSTRFVFLSALSVRAEAVEALATLRPAQGEQIDKGTHP